MSVAVRKARKKAGIRFVHPVKVATPLLERAWFNAESFGPKGTRSQHTLMPRSAKRIQRAVDARTGTAAE